MIKIRTLANGIRVITEPIEAVRSCGVGLFLTVGSRCERDGEEGLSHFIEHMLFKGTSTRDWQQVGETINRLGGNVNAYTTQETIVLHARTVDRKAHAALDFLAELLTDSIFPEREIQRERQVVLEECRMYEDNPEDLSVDRFVSNLWPDEPMGRPVIGTRRSIRQFSRDRVLDYWRREFRPERLVVALAGAFDIKTCNKVIRDRFATLGDQTLGVRHGGRRSGKTIESDNPLTGGGCAGRPRQTYLRRTIEQAHFCLGARALHRRSPDRYAFGLMNMILGGGTSSRLFREVREKRGLAYSIGSFSQLFSDRGFWAVSGGTNPGALGEVLRITRDEIARMSAEDVPEDELALAREQIIDAMLMGLENTESRMSRLAESLMAFGHVTPVDRLIQNVRRVRSADVRRVAETYLRKAPFAVSAVGPQEGQTPLARKFVVE